MARQKGLFVVFEGVDGAGTSTQLIKLLEHLERKNKYQDVLRTHEPWNSEEIKKRLAKENDTYSGAEEISKLFVEDRIKHTEELIIPNLIRGVVVLCDRYSMSTCAYQSTQGANLIKLFDMHRDNESILIPDLTFFVDVPAEIAQERIMKRGEPKEKFEEFEFQRKLIMNYREIARGAENRDSVFGKTIWINGNGPIECVARNIAYEFDKVYEGIQSRDKPV